jgi:hypothetical protein
MKLFPAKVVGEFAASPGDGNEEGNERGGGEGEEERFHKDEGII